MVFWTVPESSAPHPEAKALSKIVLNWKICSEQFIQCGTARWLFYLFAFFVQFIALRAWRTGNYRVIGARRAVSQPQQQQQRANERNHSAQIIIIMDRQFFFYIITLSTLNIVHTEAGAHASSTWLKAHTVYTLASGARNQLKNGRTQNYMFDVRGVK